MLELRVFADKSGEEPPRAPSLIEGPDGELMPNPQAGELLRPWPVARVELVGEAPDEHGFANTIVAAGLHDGYLSFENLRLVATEGYARNPVVTGDAIVLHLANGDLRYEILEPPGRYPDADDPAGYRVSHEYRTRRA